MLFFTGSVLHVKALIREVKNRNWHYGSIIFHATVLALLLAFVRPWLLVLPFVLALLRTVFIKSGFRPGTLGVVELGVSISLIASTVIAIA